MTNGRATCTAAPWLSIVGIGEDGVDGLSPVAQRLIAAAELVVGGKRHLALADDLIRGRTLAWPSPIGEAMPEIEKHRGRPVVVLASGDPFHYGVGDMLLRSIPAAETLCLPQSSSFSLAAARLGWSLQDVALGQPARPRAGRHRAPSAARGAHPRCCRGTARRPPGWRSCWSSAAWAPRRSPCLKPWAARASAFAASRRRTSISAR